MQFRVVPRVMPLNLDLWVLLIYDAERADLNIFVGFYTEVYHGLSKNWTLLLLIVTSAKEKYLLEVVC